MSELIEAVARAISGAPFPSTASTRKARAALQAIEAAGFRVVPVELTLEMSKVGSAKIPAGHGQAWVYFPEAWTAALQAAPRIAP